jgi:hypothetical protein
MLKEYIIYSDKLTNINRLLKELVGDKIQFIGDENYYKIINEVSTCIVKDNDKCKDTPNLCVVTENGKCNLILPEKNLITNKENEPIYFGRMADELIRYNRIKSFMLQPQIYLSFGNIGYNLRDNEIILIQSMLTQEYFENLVPAVTNKYVKYNSYDETQPVISQIYDNKIPLIDQAFATKSDMICDKVEKQHITSSIWKKCFPENYSEIEYSKHNFCTFQVIIDLIEKKTGEKYSVNEIKNQLFDEYKQYITNDEIRDKIVDILIIEGKKTLGDQVIAGSLSFSSFIYTDNYFLTVLDLWLLVNKFKIPTVFICQKPIKSHSDKNEFVGYGDIEDNFAFVVLPAFRAENIPNFKIIKSEKGDFFISLKDVTEECFYTIQDAIRNKISIQEYLNTFVMPSKKIYKKKKPLLIESDSESEEIRYREIEPVKTKMIIKKISPVSPEEFIMQPKKGRPSRKILVRGDTKKTKRNPKI